MGQPCEFQVSDRQQVERNILANANGVDEEPNLLEIEKHLISKMLCHTPGKRPRISECAAHPAFWSAEAAAIFLGDIANVLPSKVGRKVSPFVEELEAAMDDHVGAYCELDPTAGGSWSRLLDRQYPKVNFTGLARIAWLGPRSG
jgi:hypothetical protein